MDFGHKQVKAKSYNSLKTQLTKNTIVKIFFLGPKYEKFKTHSDTRFLHFICRRGVALHQVSGAMNENFTIIIYNTLHHKNK